MANVKINDLGLAGAVSATMQLETDIGGTSPNKVTAAQIKTFSNNGETGGKTIEGGTAATENLILDSTSNATKGEVQISNGSTLHANTTNYETLVTDDDDIPNKKYVDDSHPDTVTEVLTISSDGQTAFTLGTAPTTPAEVILVLNGQIRLYTTDFTISGTTLTWNDPGGLTLKTTDTFQIWYNVTLGAPAAPVTSVFSRVGVVTAQSGDYSVGEVTGAAASGANSDITSLSGLTTPLSIAQGGTNSGAALSNDRVMVSSAGTVIESATITTTELGLLNGIVSVSTGGADNDKFVTQGYVDDAVGPTKELFFAGTDYNANVGNIRTRVVVGTGGQRFTFAIPSDFVSLSSVNLIGIISAGAAGASKNIDLSSDYGAIGEAYNLHSESDTATTYDFTGKANQYAAIDLSVVLSSLSANDYVGIFVDHNSIGGDIDYVGIKLVYNI
jgi:hypothetical protein